MRRKSNVDDGGLGLNNIVGKVKKKAEFTFSQQTDNSLFIAWEQLYVLSCITTVLIYPYFSVFELPGEITPALGILIFSELVCLINIVLNMFKQELDETGHSK